MTYLASALMPRLLISKTPIKTLLPSGIRTNTKLIEFWLKKSFMIFHRPMKFSPTKTEDPTTMTCSRCNTPSKTPTQLSKNSLGKMGSQTKINNSFSQPITQIRPKITTEYWEFLEMPLSMTLKKPTESFR